MLDAVGQIAQASRTELDTEGLGSDIFEVMRLVKNDVIVVRQNTGIWIGEPEREVAEKEGVVDNDKIALRRLPAHPIVETGVIVMALRPATGLRGRDKVAPRG